MLLSLPWMGEKKNPWDDQAEGERNSLASVSEGAAQGWLALSACGVAAHHGREPKRSTAVDLESLGSREDQVQQPFKGILLEAPRPSVPLVSEGSSTFQ